MEKSEIEELKEKQATFRSKFQILKNAKRDFLALFRKKLEEKKIEEIRNQTNKLTETK